jgi:hypothetical protein
MDRVQILSFDTDLRTVDAVKSCTHISLTDHRRVKEVIDSFDNEKLKKLFPCDRELDSVQYFESLAMNEGCSGWRMKSLLNFAAYLSNPKNKAFLHEKLESLILDMPQDPDTNIEIYTVASLSGGTGSGLLVPLTLYVKRFFKEKTGKNPKGCALLAMPNVCEDLLTPEQQVKARANAYATIRELNAMHTAASSEDHTVNFRIGDTEDPCFGLLYDSQDPAFTNPKELPFSQIYLFKRAPCTNTVLVNAQIMAQAALSLTLDDLPSPTTSNGALFGAIEVTKTRYSEESIVSYISHKTLFDLLNEKILENTRKTARAVGISKKFLTQGEESVRSDVNGLVQAVLSLCETKDCACVEAFEGALIKRVDKAMYPFASDLTDYVSDLEEKEEDRRQQLLEEAIAEAKEQEDAKTLGKHSVSKKEKKEKKVKKSSGSSENRRLLLEHANNIAVCLEEYYVYSVSNGGKKTEARLSGVLDDLDKQIINKLLLENNQNLSPFTSLARLCKLYDMIAERAEAAQSFSDQATELLNPRIIPDFLLWTNHMFGMNCKYDTGTRERFLMTVRQNTSHLGATEFDRELYDFDLLFVYNKMRSFFRKDALPPLLARIEKLIKIFVPATLSLEDAAEEFATDTSASERLHSIPTSNIFNIGSTAMEKRAKYARFRRFLQNIPVEGDSEASLWDTVCKKIQEKVNEKIHLLIENNTDPKFFEQELYSTLLEIRGDIQNTVKSTDFYKESIDLNILSAMLAQNGQNGALTFEQALGMTFLAKFDPIILCIPENPKDREIARGIARKTVVKFPETVYGFLDENPDIRQGKTAQKYLEDLIYGAGEYLGEPAIDRNLAKNEIAVHRRILGIRPCFVEVFNEDTKDSGYYRSYKKALQMKQVQCTKMWDPHICMGADQRGALPLIKQN